MASWIRNLIILAVMLVWVPYMIVSLIRAQSPDPFVWGVPGAVYFALNPSWRKKDTVAAPEVDKSSGTTLQGHLGPVFIIFIILGSIDMGYVWQSVLWLGLIGPAFGWVLSGVMPRKPKPRDRAHDARQVS